MRVRLTALLGLSTLVIGAPLAVTAAAQSGQAPVVLHEYQLSTSAMDQLRTHWIDQLESRYRPGTWAPMRMTLDDADLALMGLPSKQWMLHHHFAQPTVVKRTADGGARTQALAGPTVTSFAGAGYFGIRPGGWLLTVTANEIGWCSLAHVYGSPGSYQISTAGHCGNVGTVATAIAVLGNRDVVLLDFGTFSRSTGDAGIGKDWALISVKAQYQKLVSPTMAFWGGPRGKYTQTGDVAKPGAINANPALAQDVVHYGHGAAIGAGGTPRTGAAITWRPTYFAFFGAITPGDSGSGSNVLTGWPAGSQRQAAGINTHIYVDSSLRTGLGTMAGTRVTQVAATLRNGQLLAYPVPAPGLP